MTVKAGHAVLLRACLAAWAVFGAGPALPAQEETRTETRVESLASGAIVRVRNRNGDIHVSGWDREEVALAAEIRDSSSRRVDLTVQRDGADLDIEAQFQQPLLRLPLVYAASPKCRMVLSVPRRVLGYFRTTNGSLAATGLEGYVRCETTNGDISLGAIAGEVSAETANGNVEARELHARIRGGTGNGRVLLEDVDGQVRMYATNGSIQARNLEGWAEGISLECTNGPIDLTLGRATGDLLAVTSNGTIRIQLGGLQPLEREPHRVHLRIPGRNQKILLTTTNGNIQVR